MKIRISDLAGKALDWAATKAELEVMRSSGQHVKAWVADEIDEGARADPYSTDWTFAGPVIERDQIELARSDSGTWTARSRWHDADLAIATGPSPLASAMRCFVAKVCGHEIDVPDRWRHE